MKICVTGAAGKVGEAVVEHLREHGHDNTLANFNVLHGAVKLGLERVVWMSSETGTHETAAARPSGCPTSAPARPPGRSWRDELGD